MNRLSLFIIGLISLLFTGCYHQTPETSDAWIVTEEQMDSISFYTTHHYTHNYNFLVTVDTLWLIVQQPSEVLSDMLVDSVAVVRDDRLVVADIMTLSSDTIDSVWVQVARDQMTIGWIHEQQMLPGVAPDNPISQFITFFSDTHLLIMLAFLVIVFAAYTLRMVYRHNSRRGRLPERSCQEKRPRRVSWRQGREDGVRFPCEARRRVKHERSKTKKGDKTT